MIRTIQLVTSHKQEHQGSHVLAITQLVLFALVLERDGATYSMIQVDLALNGAVPRGAMCVLSEHISLISPMHVDQGHNKTSSDSVI